MDFSYVTISFSSDTPGVYHPTSQNTYVGMIIQPSADDNYSHDSLIVAKNGDIEIKSINKSQNTISGSIDVTAVKVKDIMSGNPDSSEFNMTGDFSLGIVN